MASFDDFTEALKAGAKDLAKEIFDGYGEEAKNDTQAFLDKAKEDLQRWARLLAEGAITEQDFTDLVQAKKALAEIHALRQTGVALTKLERFRSQFMNLVVDTAIDVFL